MSEGADDADCNASGLSSVSFDDVSCPPAEIYNAIRSNNAELLEDLLSKQNIDLLGCLDNKVKMTVLHQAAVVNKPDILTIVLAALWRKGIVVQALRSCDSNGSTPLACTVEDPRLFSNFSALLKACEESAPDVVRWKNENDSNLLHVAVDRRCVPVLRALIARDNMQAALLELNKSQSTPLEVANSQLRMNQTQLQMEKSSFEQMATIMKWNKMTRQFHERSRFSHRMEVIKALQEIVAILEHPTVEAKAAAAAQAASEALKLKEELRRREIRDKCIELVEKGDWPNLLVLIRSNDAADKTTALETIYFAMMEGKLDDTAVPILKEEDFEALQKLLVSKNGFTRLYAASTLYFVCKEKANQTLMTKHASIMTSLLSLLRTLNMDMQLLCLNIVHTLVINETLDDKTCWIQPLLLLKSYSCSTKLQRIAGEILGRLHDESMVNPGMWAVEDVAVWLDGKEELQDRSLYCKQFIESGIDGLHLLELTHEDMKGLGVKHLSDRRRIASFVDDLRRLNAPSVVGKRDIFLSYAHINIAFARSIRNALTAAGYSVWIDEAGIRAGVKWREAIANGVEHCRAFVFVTTPRSASSEYCMDELGLAEEQKKPIFNVVLEEVPMASMDPGFRLIISRRQWTFFTDESKFGESFEKLLSGIKMTIGALKRVNSQRTRLMLLLHHKAREEFALTCGRTQGLTCSNSSHGLLYVESTRDDDETDIHQKVSKLEERVCQLESELERMRSLEREVEELKHLFIVANTQTMSSQNKHLTETTESSLCNLL
ncbi:uncharacterized protein LOC134196598 isoform X2 [Corticium candelabrum]|uniref:uncharacterized protein LOC134196598 isoform X2 n=1 Tax=Corticium candelabrum TaxID=121492 RepID=UPI002E2590BB|nr:uncharacterized protein LOC134196598 isoform X2 [Corticium candelabrum]